MYPSICARIYIYNTYAVQTSDTKTQGNDEQLSKINCNWKIMNNFNNDHVREKNGVNEYSILMCL